MPPRRSTSRGSHDDAPKRKARKRLEQEQQQQSKDRQQAGARGNDSSDLCKGDGARSKAMTFDGAPSDDRQVPDMNGSLPDAPPPPAFTINPLALRINGSPDVTLSASLNLQAPRLAPPAGWVEDPDRPASNELAEDSISLPSPGANGQKVVRENPLEYGSRRTGMCYDVRMRFHATVDEEDLHPEDPRRIFEIYKAICVAKLIDDPRYLGVVKQNDLMVGILARPVTKEEALLVHTEHHWQFLESTQALEIKDLQQLSKDGDSVYYNAESFSCARLSCGGVIETCFAVMDNRVKNAIAVVRPPGHHAEPHKAMGFCLFNNVCVATKAVQRRYPSQCKKVLILDWDVHHGNGTQTAFYDDPSVMYMSIHRYEDGSFYPGGPQGGLDRCGEGDGLGMNVNIPWATGGLGDGDYMYAFQRVIMPIALEFNPDLVIVSAGFDAAAGDALGGCYVTPAGYAHMTHMLMCLAKGKIVVCLEGGYNLRSISNSALAVTKVLMGEPPGRLHDGQVASKGAVAVINQCVLQQSRFWRSLVPREVFLQGFNGFYIETTSLGDVVRLYQAELLWKQHKMVPLRIFHDGLLEPPQNEALATRDFFKKETVLCVIHDPPTVTASPDPRSNRIELHSAFLVDAVAQYIDWAIGHGYGVVDINIPHGQAGKKNYEYDAQKQTEDLCRYMWDNYLEISDVKNIILMGVGDSMAGIIHLLTHRDCRDRLVGVLSFISDQNPLRGVRSTVDQHMTNWYYDHSQVVISDNHSAWEQSTKLRKKFGNITRLPASGVHELLAAGLPILQKWIIPELDARSANGGSSSAGSS